MGQEARRIRSALRPTTSLHRHTRAWIEQNGLTSSRKRRSSYLILSSEIALSLYCSTVDITRVAPHPLCQHANDTARGTHSDNVRWFILPLPLSLSLSSPRTSQPPQPIPLPQLPSALPVAARHAASKCSSISGTPRPCLTAARTVGPSPRMRAASASITSKSAPTASAKSCSTRGAHEAYMRHVQQPAGRHTVHTVRAGVAEGCDPVESMGRCGSGRWVAREHGARWRQHRFVDHQDI